MMSRQCTLTRTTKETDISLALTLDGTGMAKIDTGIGFFDHMLAVFCFQSCCDLTIRARGDLVIDAHHSIEDVGITLGTALGKALGDKRGISRYGFFMLPMDEAVTTAVVDLSGRYSFRLDAKFDTPTIGTMPTELIYDFWEAVAINTRMNLFLKSEYGRNTHHIAEGLFKCAGRALRVAWTIDPTRQMIIPSTKGSI